MDSRKIAMVLYGQIMRSSLPETTLADAIKEIHNSAVNMSAHAACDAVHHIFRRLVARVGWRDRKGNLMPVEKTGKRAVDRSENWTKKPWYKSRCGARARCEDKNHPRYARYGGRGIKFLLSNKEFDFLWERDNASDMIRPSIDRINNDGNYELSNCRFLEMKENAARLVRMRVGQYTDDGELIRIWPSVNDVSRSLGIRLGNLHRVLNEICGRKAMGFVWKYIDGISLKDSVIHKAKEDQKVRRLKWWHKRSAMLKDLAKRTGGKVVWPKMVVVLPNGNAVAIDQALKIAKEGE